MYMMPYEAQAWPDMGGRCPHQANLREQYASIYTCINTHIMRHDTVHIVRDDEIRSDTIWQYGNVSEVVSMMEYGEPRHLSRGASHLSRGRAMQPF